MSNKAPAFQFYFDRFNSSTALWDDAQVGKYIRLMICQANQRYVSSKQLKRVVPDDDPDILSKFKEFEPGKFRNEVLEGILTDRDNYYQRQSENGSKGGRPKNPDETQMKAVLNPDESGAFTGVNPDRNPNETSTTTSTPNTITTPNINPLTTSTKKNAAKADLYAFDREEIIRELNELAGRRDDPHSKNCIKFLNPRIKEYGKDDLIDMVRCMVYKRKGGDWEQYLRPETLFNAEKCEIYIKEMRRHRENGTKPKKDNDIGSRNINGPELMDELMMNLQREINASRNS